MGVLCERAVNAAPEEIQEIEHTHYTTALVPYGIEPYGIELDAKLSPYKLGHMRRR